MNDLDVLPNLAIDLNSILLEVAEISERARARRIESARAALAVHAEATQAADKTYRQRMQSLRARVGHMRRDRAEALAAIVTADEQRRSTVAATELAYEEACTNALHAIQLHLQSAEEAVARVGRHRIEFTEKWDAAWAAAHDLYEERARLETLKDGAALAFDEAELKARLNLECAKAEAGELAAQAESAARAIRDAAVAATMSNDYGAASAQRRSALIERRNRRAAAVMWQALARLVGEREAALAAADAALAEARLWDSEGFEALEAEERLRVQAAEVKARAEAEERNACESAIEAEATALIEKWTTAAIRASGNPHALRGQRDAALRELRGSPARNRAARVIRRVFVGLNEANQYLAGFSLTNQALPARGWRVVTDDAVLVYDLDRMYFAGWLWRERRQSDEVPFPAAFKEAVVKYTFGVRPKVEPGTTIRDAVSLKMKNATR